MAKLVNKTEVVQKEDLLVFGYSCKLFKDDEKAIYVENGCHLIPWMGNPSLMIDRYDVRGALYDLDSAASVGGNDTSYMSDVERKEEELCEQERYLALYHDLEATAEQEEEEKKRLLVELETGTSGFKQVGFFYDTPSSDSSELQHNQPATVHPHGYTPHSDDDLFIPPPTLLLPTGLPVPNSIKQHKIIVKTAKFIAKQGSQMEIVLKTKQANNSMFGFLSFDNYLNHYYKHIISLIKANKFREDEAPNNNGCDGDAHQVSFNPSADAAPGIKTPKAAAKTAPPADCSYSKLISKIRENQAKSGVNLVATTDSRPQSPLLAETPATPIISATTTAAASDIAAVDATAAAPLPIVDISATATPSVTSTPTSGNMLQSLPSNKLYAGLVDYPSFNRTNEDDNDGYSLSESDSDNDPPRSPTVSSQDKKKALVNGGKPTLTNKRLTSDGASKKTVPSVAAAAAAAAAKTKTKESLLSTACNKVESYDDIRWPSPAEQMIIDKIACYIVKNGSKFEKAMKSRGDSRFQFLDSSHDHFSYYLLKRDLYSEVFGELISHNVSKRTERANDLKSVVASMGQVSCSNSNNKSWSSSDTSKKSGSGSSSGGGAHTICFSIKQRRDQEVTLPATSFPLESSSSEEDLDDLEEEERERRTQEREERRQWRKMKREQFEKERREKKEKDDRAKRQEEEKRLKHEKETLKLRELEEQENASGDEEMYDIFKYAQESNKDVESADTTSCQQRPPTPDTGASPPLKSSKTRRKAPSDPKLRRKKAAHAFLSKLKGAPEDEPMIGPQLPPGMEIMDISPKASPAASPAPSSPSHTPPLLASSTTPPRRSSCTPPPLPPPDASSGLVATSAGSAPLVAAVADDTDSLSSLLSGLPGASKKTRHGRHGLLAAAVTSILTNDCCCSVVQCRAEGVGQQGCYGGARNAVAEKSVSELLFADEIGGSADLLKTKSLDVKHRGDSKSRRHKQKRRRDLIPSPDRSSSRQRSVASSKKRKRKRSHSRHHSHHKKRHHRSPPARSSSSSHRKSASSSSHVAKKKKKNKSSSSSIKDRPKKKKSKRHRSASVSSVSSVSSSSSSSSRSSSTESSYRSRGSKRSPRDSSGESASDHEVQIISDSDGDNKTSGSSSRASSVVSVSSSTARREPSLPLATPASSRASSTSRDTGGIIGSEARLLSSGAASPALPALPSIISVSSSPLLVKPLPTNFDMKTSSAMAKITEGLRAKVHALMDKKRPDD